MTSSNTIAISLVAIGLFAASLTGITMVKPVKIVSKTASDIKWTAVGAQSYFTVNNVKIEGTFDKGSVAKFTTTINVLQPFTHVVTHVKLVYKSGIIQSTVTDQDFPEATPTTYAAGPATLITETAVNQNAPSGTYTITYDFKGQNGAKLQSYQLVYRL